MAKVTDKLIERIEESLKNEGFNIKYLVWLNQNDRDLGEPIVVSSPSNLKEAIYNPTAEYEEGGCLEIVIDGDEDVCIYHHEENEEYICQDAFEFLNIDFSEFL